MFGECINISDDEDEVQVLETVVNLEPVVIDLTKSDGPSQKGHAFSSCFEATSKTQQQDEQTQSKTTPGDTQSNGGATFRSFRWNNSHNGHSIFGSAPQKPWPSQPRQPVPEPPPHTPPPHTPPPHTPPPHSPPQPNSHPPSQPTFHSQSQTTFHPPSQTTPQPPSQPTPQSNVQQTSQNTNSQKPKPKPPPPPPPPPPPQPSQPQPQPQSQPKQKQQQYPPRMPEQTSQTQHSIPVETQQQARQQSSDQKTQEEHNPQQPKRPAMSDEELLTVQKRLGNEKYRNNLFDDAVRIYKRAILLANNLDNKEMSAILHFNLAMTYDKLKYFDQAVDECSNAVKYNASYLKAHQKRAEIFMNQRKFDEAVICYEHLRELDSTNQYFTLCLTSATQKAKQTRKKDCYEVLGLNSNFTREDIKKAYRRLALLHHPDRHSGADIVTRRIHEKRFKDAAEAYSFIQTRFGYSL